MPGVTARARCCPVVPAAVRTQRGPSRLGRVRHRRLTASDLPGAKGEAGTPVTVASLPGRRAAGGRPQGRPWGCRENSYGHDPHR